MDFWKERVVRFLKLKTNGIVFNPHLYDFVYVSNKRSIGIITENNSDGTLCISFFKSLKNQETFVNRIKLDKSSDIVIPSYESLLSTAHMLIKKISANYSTGEFEIEFEEKTDPNQSKHKLYGRLNILFKKTGDRDDYDNLLNLVVDLIKESQVRHSGRD